MGILIDTNVLLDYVLMREPFFESAKNIFTLCDNNSVEGYIAAHSIMNSFYILRKDYTLEQRRSILKEFCEMLTVVGITNNEIINALDNDDFSDVEDCLQYECARACNADFIVTRNIKDYSASMIPPIMPDDFLKKIERKE